MQKKFKIIIPILSVLLVAAVLLVLFVTGIIGNKKITVENADDTAQSGYSEMVSYSGSSDFPYMQTEISTVFYKLSPTGKVEFYEYKNNIFSPYSGKTSVITAKLTMSNEDISMRIFYIEKGGKTIGYGLHKNTKADGSNELCTYAFARLCNMPSVYSKRGKLLLIDTNKDNVYLLDKNYSDAYSLNMTSGTAAKITTERDRSVGKDGSFVDDWFITTDSLIKSVKKYPLFISGRFYSSDTENKYDVFVNTSYTFEKKVTGTLGTYLREKGNGFVFLKKTSGGFISANRVNGKSDDKKIAEFKGDLSKDFIINSDWIFDKNNFTFTNLLTGKEYKTSKTSADSIDRFIVSPEEDKFVLYCTSGNSQAVLLFNAKTNETKLLTEKSNNEIYDLSAANSCWIDNNTFIDTSFNSDSSTTYKVIKF